MGKNLSKKTTTTTKQKQNQNKTTTTKKKTTNKKKELRKEENWRKVVAAMKGQQKLAPGDEICLSFYQCQNAACNTVLWFCKLMQDVERLGR